VRYSTEAGIFIDSEGDGDGDGEKMEWLAVGRQVKWDRRRRRSGE